MAAENHPQTGASLLQKMRSVGLPEAAVHTFLHHFAVLEKQLPTTLDRTTISPVEQISDVSGLHRFRAQGLAAMGSVVTIKLNGGLGTSMGLQRAKSLIEVRPGLSFLDLVARQVQHLRSSTGIAAPLLMMSSFRTEQDTLAALSAYPDLVQDRLPLTFLQHRVPKVRVHDLAPVEHPADPEMEWCPPGHGDVYTALFTTGLLDLLIEQHIHFAFLSNADNLGAVLEPEILGFMVNRGVSFLLEASDRTAADRKGGHLCRLDDGRLALRESAQCPPEETNEFQDIERYRYFNSNNIWVHLPTLRSLLTEHAGVLPLTTIVNRKTVDPNDPDSDPVYQLETAMGAAISLFPEATAVRVDRRRFSPVKTTDDLLAVRSDAFVLGDDWQLSLDPRRRRPPTVRLDPRFYRRIDDFEKRFPAGPPSLLHCETLEVTGDVTFEEDVVVENEVRIAEERATIPAGTVLRSD